MANKIRRYDFKYKMAKKMVPNDKKTLKINTWQTITY